MSELSEKVVAAKIALVTSLGENSQRYFSHLKSWFSGKWTQEEFDFECRKILTGESVHLHNQFFLALLNKIDALRLPQTSSTSSISLNRSSRKRKRSSRSGVDRVNFEPYDLFEFLPDENVELIRQPNASDDQPPSMPKYCVQEYFLPDIGFIMGRMMVGAWEHGLVHVDDAVAEYVVLAVQSLLKNIITAVILSRKQCKLTAAGNYFYDVGVTIPDPFVRNRASRQKTYEEKSLPERYNQEMLPEEEFQKSWTPRQKMYDDKNIGERFASEKLPEEETFFSACEQLYPVRKCLITVNDVYKVLRERNILLSHSVHSVNMERMSQMLH